MHVKCIAPDKLKFSIWILYVTDLHLGAIELGLRGDMLSHRGKHLCPDLWNFIYVCRGYVLDKLNFNLWPLSVTLTLEPYWPESLTDTVSYHGKHLCKVTFNVIRAWSNGLDKSNSYIWPVRPCPFRYWPRSETHYAVSPWCLFVPSSIKFHWCMDRLKLNLYCMTLTFDINYFTFHQCM